MNLSVRQAKSTDLDSIMLIINQAADFLRETGSPQWSNNDKPTRHEMASHIKKELTYVLILNDKVVATANLSLDQEKGYDTLQFGDWDEMMTQYVSIHRFAVAPCVNGKGYATLFLNILVKLCHEQGVIDLRIDTHPKNKGMQRVITKCGFSFKGIIELPVESGERYAYQLVMSYP